MKKVLIVDNSSFMRMFTRKIVEKTGHFKTLEASSKESAINAVKVEKPEVILLDLNMSEATMDGIDVLNNVMKTSPETAVFILSAVGHQEVKDKCIELGAKGYIKKPIDTKVLVKALEEYR